MDLLPFHKLLTGGFRIGVSRGNLCKALAEVGQVDPAIIAQRISGDWDPWNTKIRTDCGRGKTGGFMVPSLSRFAWRVPCRKSLNSLGDLNRLVGGMEMGWDTMPIFKRGKRGNVMDTGG